MRLAEVQRRVREQRRIDHRQANGERHLNGYAWTHHLDLYSKVLRTLLDHDISDDARQIIEAALEAER